MNTDDDADDDDDEGVMVEAQITQTSVNSGRGWVEVPMSVYDQGKEAVLKWLNSNACEFVDINWDHEETEEVSVDSWELA